MSEHAQICWEA